MLAAVARAARVCRCMPDSGFSLIEVVVATIVIGAVMTSLMTFFASTLTGTSRQFGIQTAAQLADDAIERVRAERGTSVLEDRTQVAVQAQWAAADAKVKTYLDVTTAAWDDAVAVGATPLIPLVVPDIERNKLKFTQNWYIGRCWQLAAGGDCTKDSSRPRAYYRAVVAVTWPSRQYGTTCIFVSSTLINTNDADPVFNPNAAAAPPVINSVVAQTAEVEVPVDFTVTASGGAAPLTWNATGLPSGVQMAANGRIQGTPVTAGTPSALVTVTDGFGLQDTASIAWTVRDKPSLTKPADQSSPRNLSIATFNVARSGGTGPFTWTQSSLPVGLVINASTGAITGKPTTPGASTVTVTVTDTYGKSAQTTFKWTVT